MGYKEWKSSKESGGTVQSAQSTAVSGVGKGMGYKAFKAAGGANAVGRLDPESTAKRNVQSNTTKMLASKLAAQAHNESSAKQYVQDYKDTMSELTRYRSAGGGTDTQFGENGSYTQMLERLKKLEKNRSAMEPEIREVYGKSADRVLEELDELRRTGYQKIIGVGQSEESTETGKRTNVLTAALAGVSGEKSGTEKEKTEAEKKAENKTLKGFAKDAKSAAAAGLDMYLADEVETLSAAYEAGQGGRTVMNNEMYSEYQRNLERAKREYQIAQEDGNTGAMAMAQNEIDRYQKLVDAMGTVVNDNVQEKATKETEALSDSIAEKGSKKLESATEGRGFWGQSAMNAVSSSVQSMADRATSLALTGLGANTGRVTQYAPLAARVYGGAVREARQNGATEAQQTLYGITQAAIEVGTEMLGGIAWRGTYGKGTLDDVIEKSVTKTAEKLGKTYAGKKALERLMTLGTGAASEGLEEVIAAFAEWATPAIYGGDVNTWAETVSDAVSGFVTGGMSGAMGTVGNMVQSAALDVDSTATGTKIIKNGNAEKLGELTGKNLKNASAMEVGDTFKEAVEAAKDALVTEKKIRQYLSDSGVEGNADTADVMVGAIGKALNGEALTQEETAQVRGIKGGMKAYLAAAQDGVTEAGNALRAQSAAQAENAKKLLELSKLSGNENTVKSAAAQVYETAAPGTETAQAAMAAYEKTTPEYKAAAAQAMGSEMLTNRETSTQKAIESVGRVTGQNDTRLAAAKLESQNAEEYKALTQAAYEMGYSGVEKNAALSSEKLAGLTMPQRVIAYNQGVGQRRLDVKKSGGSAAAQVIPGRLRGDGVKLEELEANYGGKPGELAGILRSFAELSGRNITLVQATADKNGVYHLQDKNGTEYAGKNTAGEIVVDIRAGLGTVKDAETAAKWTALRTLGHELVHDMERWAEGEYDEFKRYCFSVMEQNGVNVDTLISAYAEEYGVGYTEASDEVLAESLADILPQTKFMEGLVQENRNLAQQVLDTMKSFVKRLRAAFAGMAENSYEGKKGLTEATDGGIRYLEDIVKRYDAVMAKAMREMNTEKKAKKASAEAEGEVRYQRNALSKEAERFREKIQKWEEEGRAGGKRFILGSTGDVLQGLGAIESDVYMLSDKINAIFEEHPEITVKEIQGIQEILENPVIILKSRNAAGADENSRLVIIGMEKANNGLPILAAFDLRPRDRGMYLYDMQKVSSAYTKDREENALKMMMISSSVLYADKEKASTLLHSAGFQNARSSVERTGFMGSISYDGKYVNIKGVPFSEFYSGEDGKTQYQRRPAVDSEGNALTEAQEAYFADSKVRDEEGKLLVMYHGTAEDFTIFDPKKLGGKNGTAEGYGIYFADTTSVTDAYGGKTLKGYVNMKRPARADAKTIRITELKKLIEATVKAEAEQLAKEDDSYRNAAEAARDTWISNYTDTYGTSISESCREVAASILKMNENDMNVVQEVMKGMSIRSYNDAYTFYDTLTKITGIDGYMTEWNNASDGSKSKIVVAFNSNQFKNADNKNPTENEDIRYQRRRTEMNDQDVLERAEEINAIADAAHKWTGAEETAMYAYKNRLAAVEALEEERKKLGQQYRAENFGVKGENGETVQKADRAAAAKTQQRILEVKEALDTARDRLKETQDSEEIQSILAKTRTLLAQEREASTDEMAKRYADKVINAGKRSDLKKSILKSSKDIMDWLENPDTKTRKYVPDGLKGAVSDLVLNIQYPARAKKNLAEAVRLARKQIEEADDGEKRVAIDANLTDNMRKTEEEIRALYSKYMDDGFPTMDRMTADELYELDKILRQVKAAVTNANSVQYNGNFETIEEMARTGTVEELGDVKLGRRANFVTDYILWKNARPYDVLTRFGKGGEALAQGFMRAQAKYAQNISEIENFSKTAWTGKQVREWRKTWVDVPVGENEKRVRLTELMGLYCLVKQEDSRRHIGEYGVQFSSEGEGKPLEKLEGVMTEGQMNYVETLMNSYPEAKAAADKLQKFMETTGAGMINEITQQLYGIDAAKEKNYYPIESNQKYLKSKDGKDAPEQADMYTLLNMSFTKNRNKHADNQIMARDIFTVFSGHMSGVAQYNAFALPVLDAIRWLNWSPVNVQVGEGNDAVEMRRESTADKTVTSVLTDVFGTKKGARKGVAVQYVEDFIKAINGKSAATGYFDRSRTAVQGRANASAVAYNIGVAFNQPLSIIRAGLVMDGKYIAQGKLDAIRHQRKLRAEMQEHSGIAKWKKMGFSSNDVSKNVEKMISGERDIIGTATEIGMHPAEMMDELTWTTLWAAAKRQAYAEGASMQDADYWEKVNGIFEKVIYGTQVVDTPLTRSELMRSKSAVDKAITAFMGESTASWSSLMRAYNAYEIERQRGSTRKEALAKTKNVLLRTIAVHALSTAVNVTYNTVRDTIRDDDDYETIWQKLMEHLPGNLIDAIPIFLLPGVSQAYDLARYALNEAGVEWAGQSSEPTTVAVQVIKKIVDALKIRQEKREAEENGKEYNGYTTAGEVYKWLQAVSAISGIGASSAMRSLMDLWNTVAPNHRIKTYEQSEDKKIKYAYLDGYLDDEAAVNALIEAGEAEDADEAGLMVKGWSDGGKWTALKTAVDGNDAAAYAAEVKALTALGVEEDEIHTQARSAIRDSFDAGKLTEKEAAQYIQKYGGYEKEDAEAKAHYWSFQKLYPKNTLSQTAFESWETTMKPYGVNASEWETWWKELNAVETQKDARGNVTKTKKEQIEAYVRKLGASQSVKKAILEYYYPTKK